MILSNTIYGFLEYATTSRVYSWCSFVISDNKMYGITTGKEIFTEVPKTLKGYNLLWN